MENQVLVIGSTCVDVIIRVDHLPHTEENLHPDGQQFAIGGCAYNAANILGRGGAPAHVRHPVGLQGCVRRFRQGSTPNAPFAQPVYLPNAANGCCYCLVEAGGERTFLSIHGAEYALIPRGWRVTPPSATPTAMSAGLKSRKRPAVCWWIISKPPRLIESCTLPGPRGAQIAPERTAALFALHPMLHLNASEARAAFRALRSG